MPQPIPYDEMTTATMQGFPGHLCLLRVATLSRQIESFQEQGMGHVDVFTASLVRDFCSLVALNADTYRTFCDGINGDCGARSVLRLKNVAKVGLMSTA